MDVFPRISLLARLYAIGFHSSVRIGDYGGQNCSVRFFRHARLFLVRCVAVHPHRRSFGGNQEHLEQRRPVLEISLFFFRMRNLFQLFLVIPPFILLFWLSTSCS